MVDVDVYDADRMKVVEDANLVSGVIDENKHLIMTRHNGTPLDAGLLPSADASRVALIAYKSLTIAGGAINPTPGLNILQDIDATNMVFSFIAPTSGKVLIRLSARVEGINSGGGPGGGNIYWGLRDDATLADIAVTPQLVWQDLDYLNDKQSYRESAEFRIFWLTPGVAYTYRWAQKNTGVGTYGTSRGGSGASVMEVYSLP